MADVYTVSDYLLDRLAELGVDAIFGVPGDYTLAMLDHVVSHRSVRWAGCTNELNAGYAADGYGRMRGVGALMTTFGVGELSAINALTGSFAEHVPVVHVVGAPSSTTQAAHRIVHHSLGDGVFDQFLDMHARITCARSALTAANASREIDRVLTMVRDAHLPGYLLLPSDVGEAAVDRPSAPLHPAADITSPDALAAFAEAVDRLLRRVGDVTRVRVLAGLLVHRLGATGQLNRLLAAGPLLHATSLWAKSLVDESNPRYLGIYAGAASDPEVRTSIENAGALIVAGVQFTDLNSGFFTHRITRATTIEIGASTASVGEAMFAPLSLGAALDRLADLIPTHDGVRLQPAWRPPAAAPGPLSVPAGPLTQAQLWDAVGAHLRAGDIVVAEQGTSFYGMATHRLPRDVIFIGQPLWASIGYSLPAMLGACLARRTGRGVLLIGDGAAQMTVQELSTILREAVRAIVVLVDNGGYTAERAIHGPGQPYNDIARWDWTALPAALGDGVAVRGHTVRTGGDLETALREADESRAGLTMIRAIVARMDIPDLLSILARALRTANARSR